MYTYSWEFMGSMDSVLIIEVSGMYPHVHNDNV